MGHLTASPARSIPFVDLGPQHDEVRAEIEGVLGRILDTSSFIGGEYVEGFERAFAAFVGVDHAVGVGSGTDALRVALQAVGVEPGDAVVTVAHTFIATAEAITQAGAIPLFVDIDARTMTMDPGAVESLLRDECNRDGGGTVVHGATGRRVTALVPVHLYGHPAHMEPLLRLAREFGLRVVEDAAQAHGARCRLSGHWRACGAIGDAGAFSFYPTKNLGAIGEAGAVTTDDPAVADRVRALRDHGQREKNVHETAAGSNARLDAVQAAVLAVKLARLDSWNEARRAVAARYAERLAPSGLTLPAEADHARHVYHLYVVRTPDRDRLRKELAGAGIETGLHYPTAVHRQPAYSDRWPGSGLPRTERSAAEVLSLPMFPHLAPEAVDHVCDQVVALTA